MPVYGVGMGIATYNVLNFPASVSRNEIVYYLLYHRFSRLLVFFRYFLTFLCPCLGPLAQKMVISRFLFQNVFRNDFWLLPRKWLLYRTCSEMYHHFQMRVNDSNKSKFARMERELHKDDINTPPDFRTTAECQDFINQAIHDPVFLRYYPHAAEINVFVRPGRGARRINWWREDYSIAVPKDFRRKHLLLHAAAHMVQPEDSVNHGWQFLKLYLALTHRELGKEASEALRTALKDSGISFRKPRKDSDTEEYKQMLIDRMRKINESRR